MRQSGILKVGSILAAWLFVVFTSGAAVAGRPGVTGTWTGQVTIGSTPRTVTLQLHQRANGKVIGYVAGGTQYRTVVDGNVAGGVLTLDLEFADPGLSRTVTISATAGPTTMTGTTDSGDGAHPITLQRVRQPLTERRFLFAKPAGDSATNITDLAVVLDSAGHLVSGSFVGETDCNLFACGGGITSFAEAGNNLQIGFESAGGCTMTGSLSVTFDPTTKMYSGTYSLDNCGVATSGALLGAKTPGTRTDDVASVLSTFGQLADDLEAGSSFSAPYAPFHPDYLHKSQVLADRLAELNAQVADYNSIEVDMNRFRNIVTVAEPDVLPQLDQPFGVDFHDRRSGLPVAGGARETFRDVDTRSGADELKYIAKLGNDWVIYGDQVMHDIPFAGYSMAGDHVVLPTAGGDIYLSIGPWGAHVGPHTGHAEGNGKADWMGQYAWSLDQLTVLADDNGNGICDSGETCGIAAADLEARSLDYVAPTDNFKIVSVTLERLESPGFYYGTDEHWRIEGKVGPYNYSFVHMRKISADLRNAMMAAGYTDPWTVHAPSGNLITGDALTFAKGATLGRPQIVAREVAGHPGYYAGGGAIPESPWQQIEFFTYNNGTGRQESFYTWLPSSLEADLAQVLESSGLNPAVFRYSASHGFLAPPRWKAEMALSNATWMDRLDYSSIYSALGGWWENPGDGTCASPELCDQLFSIYPISKGTVFYDPSLYQPDVSYLTIVRDGAGIQRYGEVVSPSEPDPISGSMVIRWENFDQSFYGYQAVSYLLVPGSKMLKIAWGPVTALQADAVAPAVPLDSDICDGISLTCHNHDRFGPP